MSRRDEERVALVIAFLVSAFLAFTAVRAWAQPPVAHGLVGSAAHDWLARACFAETGTHEAACAAQVHVLLRRAELRGSRVVTMTRRYSQPLRGTHRRSWVQRLTTHGRRPAGFPADASWARTQERFRDVHALVGDVLVGNVPDPCPEALHFAGPPSLDGGAPRGFVEVCEDVHPRQRFFARSSTGGAS